MKHQIRKRENVTMYLASEVIDLDDEKFRFLEEDPYTGSTEEEFLKYITNIIESGEIPYDLDFDQAEELEKLIEDCTMESFGNSAEKGADQWFELGTSNEKYIKYGNFEVKFSSENE